MKKNNNTRDFGVPCIVIDNPVLGLFMQSYFGIVDAFQPKQSNTSFIDSGIIKLY